MCRMLGIYTSKPETLPLTLCGNFLDLATYGKIKPDWEKGHNDGWGIAGYLGNKWATHFGRSYLSANLERENFILSSQKAINSSSKILIYHIRKATPGFAPKIANSHPFISGNWIFAHNGAIINPQIFILPESIKAEGDTDSEKFFIYIVEKIKHAPLAKLPETLKKNLDELIPILKFTSLTFLISDGNWLIGYRRYSESPDYYTLYFANTILNPDGAKISLFCSEPIGNLNWQEIKNNQMFAINTITGELLKLS